MYIHTYVCIYIHTYYVYIRIYIHAYIIRIYIRVLSKECVLCGMCSL
jgi:hypothetical protein